MSTALRQKFEIPRGFNGVSKHGLTQLNSIQGQNLLPSRAAVILSKKELFDTLIFSTKKKKN